MPKRKAIEKNTLIAAVTEAAEGKSIRKLQADHDLSNRAARQVAAAAGMHAVELREAVSANLQEAALKMSDRLNRESGNLSIGQIPVSLAITLDKLSLIHAERPIPRPQVTINISGTEKTKEEVIRELFRHASQPFIEAKRVHETDSH